MANQTLLKSNYRKITKAINDLEKNPESTDDALVEYRHATSEVPDTYNNDKSENQVKPIALAVANRNLSYSIKHREPQAFKIDTEQYTKIIEENNGKKHWLLYDYKKNQLINPTQQEVTNIMKNYQQGLKHDLDISYQKQEDQGVQL